MARREEQDYETRKLLKRVFEEMQQNSILMERTKSSGYLPGALKTPKQIKDEYFSYQEKLLWYAHEFLVGIFEKFWRMDNKTNIIKLLEGYDWVYYDKCDMPDPDLDHMKEHEVLMEIDKLYLPECDMDKFVEYEVCIEKEEDAINWKYYNILMDKSNVGKVLRYIRRNFLDEDEVLSRISFKSLYVLE